MGLNDFGVLNQGPIAAYSDEVYNSSNAAQIFQLLDLERIEVLRGPQGTLYGRNATGGAVNFISIRFNGSAFYYDYSDLQVFAFVIVNGVGFSTISNAADAEIYGAELEFQWLPVENLFINLGAGYLQTEYKDFVIPSGDYSGNEITMSPELTFNGLVQYDIPLNSAGVLTLQTDFNYQDSVWFDSLNNPLLSEDDYWLVNARVSWTSPDEKWQVAAFGRNLTNEEYMVYAFDLSFFGFNEEMIATPRSYGIEATYQF